MEEENGSLPEKNNL